MPKTKKNLKKRSRKRQKVTLDNPYDSLFVNHFDGKYKISSNKYRCFIYAATYLALLKKDIEAENAKKIIENTRKKIIYQKKSHQIDFIPILYEMLIEQKFNYNLKDIDYKTACSNKGELNSTINNFEKEYYSQKPNPSNTDISTSNSSGTFHDSKEEMLNLQNQSKLLCTTIQNYQSLISNSISYLSENNITTELLNNFNSLNANLSTALQKLETINKILESENSISKHSIKAILNSTPQDPTQNEVFPIFNAK